MAQSLGRQDQLKWSTCGQSETRRNGSTSCITQWMPCWLPVICVIDPHERKSDCNVEAMLSHNWRLHGQMDISTHANLPNAIFQSSGSDQRRTHYEALRLPRLVPPPLGFSLELPWIALNYSWSQRYLGWALYGPYDGQGLEWSYAALYDSISRIWSWHSSDFPISVVILLSSHSFSSDIPADEIRWKTILIERWLYKQMASSEKSYAAIQALLDGPSLKPPSGVTPSFDNAPNLNEITIIVISMGLLLGGLAVSIRMYTKIFLTRSTSYDDCECWLLRLQDDWADEA